MPKREMKKPEGFTKEELIDLESGGGTAVSVAVEKVKEYRDLLLLVDEWLDDFSITDDPTSFYLTPKEIHEQIKEALNV